MVIVLRVAVLSHLQGYAAYYNWGVYVPTEVCNLIVIVNPDFAIVCSQLWIK